jgi:hypothetical protein
MDDMLNSNRMALALACLISALAWSGAAEAGAPAASAAAVAGMARISPNAIRADMRFLADDLLEGRGTGTRGFDIAAKFMATQFEGLGLQPAGDSGSFLQTVPLRAMKVDRAKSAFAWTRSGKRETLAYDDDYFLRGDADRGEVAVEAPLVFAGFGITAPEQGYDDYRTINAKGKIVAVIYGAPKFESSLKAHYSPSVEKAKNAVAHGAVGLIVLNDPRFEGLYPYKKRVRDLRVPNYLWIQTDGKPHDYLRQLKAFAYLSTEATERIFEGSRQSAQQVFAGVKEGRLSAFDLPVRAGISTVTQSSEVHSSNIVARLEGSDPVLKSEYVVFTAHLDHLGRDESAQGDGIYNGALDNASGSAIMLEIARSMSQMSPRPRRSVLFISVTGEEIGLLGSDYYANNPTVPKTSIVANINTDEDRMLWPLKDVVAFGAEHSSLGAIVHAAADRLHLAVSPDPAPDKVEFVRSDQYSFIKQGIPSLALTPGVKSDDPAIHPDAILEKWEETRYHQPSDDMEQPGLDFDSAVAYARMVLLCGYLVTEAPQRPVWNKGDFFGNHFGMLAR